MNFGPAARVHWGQLAVDCGFYDQPHLIGEFRAFAGVSPTAYVAAGARHASHLPLVD